MSHVVAYILQFQESIVYKIPPGGEGVYSQPKIYRDCLSGYGVVTSGEAFKTSNVGSCTLA